MFSTVIKSSTKKLWNTRFNKKLSKGVCITLIPKQKQPPQSNSLSIRNLELVSDAPEIDELISDPVSTPVSGKDTSWGFTLKDLQESQSQDPDLEFLIAWLQTQITPEANELSRSSPTTKRYWNNRESFVLIHNVVYYKDPVDSESPKLVLPPNLRQIAIQWHHSIPSAGHQGMCRTLQRVRQKFYWFKLKRDIKQFIVGCAVCNQNKKNAPLGKCPLTDFQAGAPMERVHIDFLGPLPTTSQGHEYILVMVDQFTKWVECVPLPNQTAEVTAKAVIDHFFSRFGTPFQIISDQGRNFESNLFAEMCKQFEVHKARTTPYRPSANGQVERYNRTLMDAVRCFTGKDQPRWDLCLPQIAGALRSAVNRQTGFTANKLMLGREINLPAHLMFPFPSKNSPSLDQFVTELIEDVQIAHETARDTLKTTTRRMKRDYDLKIREKSYNVGEVVYVLDTATIKGQCKKLSPPWKGPMIIVKKFSPYIYRLKNRNTFIVANHDRLKLCTDQESKLPQWIIKFKKNPSVSDPGPIDVKEYCHCRQPDDGRMMIQCEYCNEWYHGSCVNLTTEDTLSISKYKCKDCINRNVR